jgi:Beta-galactosidase
VPRQVARTNRAMTGFRGGREASISLLVHHRAPAGPPWLKEFPGLSTVGRKSPASFFARDDSLIRHAFVLLLALLFASPAHAAWDSFEIIQWQRRDQAQLETLRRLGMTATMIMADRDGTGIPLAQQTPAVQAAGLRWYIENIATDLYSSYHRYTPGKPVNWRFLEAQQRYRANPTDTTALLREPPLLDPAWLERIRRRLTDTVAQQKSSRPLYYSLGDETGIADLTAFWDFDLSPVSVAGFRTWLHSQYGSLAALNTEWGTAYASWDSIQPEITNVAMARTDDNFAAWNDFKAWMDTSFADALRIGTDAIHLADPTALSAIEGVQIPGWGGYDYTKLVRAVDVMEAGDDGVNVSIIRSLNPRIVPLTTGFAATPADLHQLWRAVLDGARGLVLWDEDNGIVRPDASPGPRAAAYAPVFATLRGTIGRRLVNAEPIYDPIAILYSPVSFRVRWMLDHRPAGSAWMQRSSESELADNAWRAALRGYAAALARMGARPRYVTPADLAAGLTSVKTLILPHSIALSDAEIGSINAFAARGGLVIAETPPGAFDGHGRRRPPPPIAATIVPPAELEHALALTPAFPVEAPGDDVDTYLFRSRGQLLLALQRRALGETAETVTVTLHGRPARDLASGRDYGHMTRLTLTLDPITPVFLAIGE